MTQQSVSVTNTSPNNVTVNSLRIARCLYDLVADEIAPGTGITPDEFWGSLSAIVQELGPINQTLLDKRNQLQTRIDDWHQKHSGQTHDPEAYQRFLTEIGYLLPEGPDFEISTAGVDPEISSLAGPQLVVPVNNARYALNATNARWGSLYDALYGTDMIPDEGEYKITSDYNSRRGERVVALAAGFLDDAVPLANGSHTDVVGFELQYETDRQQLSIRLADGNNTVLKNPEQFAGHRTDGQLKSLLLRNNGLHIDICLDPDHPVGRTHPAGIRDVVLESAITTIQDCEDSVAAVDAEDKTRVYRNWLGLIKGDLQDSFDKGGHLITRCLHEDRQYTAPDGSTFTLPGRSLMLIRNVGLHMLTDAVTSLDGDSIYEGILDGMITSLIALHDLQANGKYQNSKAESIYIVKPKLHGPEEVAFTNRLFDLIENALGLEQNTIKLGIMDEERRTTLNLKECIRAARERIIFINTGFLDRTGDEIHTSMEAGPMLCKNDLKTARWIKAYENWNVDIGLECGLNGKAQIGKGMWAMPDRMLEMVKTKVAHPLAGANCAWVPSPTAATLHAIHYHKVNVQQRQAEIANRPRASLTDLLAIPMLPEQGSLSANIVQHELDNNIQGILGYVVHWINRGIGCSKVPDINNVGLMEDRATLRISSQHIANWLHHGICSRKQVLETFERMADIVDRQNAGDPDYLPLTSHQSGPAYQAALELVFQGRALPNGYTEPVLHAKRREFKRSLK